MPWTTKEFHDRHAKDLTPSQARRATAQANAMLEAGANEGEAIATSIKTAKKTMTQRLYPEHEAGNE